uniref:C2 domain-containing protein n=1 Tax=Macrostomum lignano TaxID=282301 RepID=A0A1I8GPF5_9PLAT
LAVTVRKARNLRVRKEASSGQPGDCYVRLAMENDDRRVHTTSVKKKTNNPNFDEKFCFQIATASLESQTLLMTVFHVDKQKRQKAIGHVAYPLRELLSVDKDCRIFRDLDSEAGDSLIFNRVADLSQTIIKVTMMHHATGIGSLFDKPLGSVVLGCELFAKRRELEHWREMSANPEQTITYWHSLCAAAV